MTEPPEACDTPVAASPLPPTSLAPHRIQRSRRLWLAVLTGLITKPLAIVISFVTVPLFIQYLGADGFGLFEAITGLAAWVSLTNLGLGFGVLNRLIECNVRGDVEAARRYVSTLMITMSVIVAAGAIGWGAIALLPDWAAIFDGDQTPFAGQVTYAVLATGLLTLAGMLGRTQFTIYNAYQENHRLNFWDGLTKCLTLAAACLVVLTPCGLLGVVAAMLGVPALMSSINAIWLFGFEKPELRPRLGLFRAAHLREILGQGFGLFLLATSLMLIHQSDKILIGVLMDPSAVTDYAVTGRVFLIAYGFYTLLLAPLWPAHGEALRRGDVGWVRQAMFGSMALGVGSAFACGLLMLLLGDSLVRLWTQNTDVQTSRPLITGFTIVFMLRSFADSQSIVLNAAGVIRPQLVAVVSYALLNLAATIVLIPRFGIAGVAWGSAVTGIITIGWSYPVMVQRCLHQATVTAESGN